MLASFPLVVPRHGGQVRAASLATAARACGWQVTTAGLYLHAMFPADEHGKDDIVLPDDGLAHAVADHMLFGDLVAARHAAATPEIVTRVRDLLDRIRPAIIVIEQPWCWLPLQKALAGEADWPPPAIIYSSQNIEWRMRPELYHLGLRRGGSDAMVLETRALEASLCQRADIVLSISDSEAEEIAQETGRAVVYLPPASTLADQPIIRAGRHADEARAADTRYAALLGSNYWPNIEGFLDLFPDGLGFLRPHERIWVAGALGTGLITHARYRDYQSINDSRLRVLGHIEEADKPGFFGAAACVLVPVLMGGGSKLKTADAIASGRPVITTSHGIDGYGPIARPAIDQGIYVADTPRDFQSLVLRALREGLPGCAPSVRAELQQQRLADRLGPILDSLSDAALALDGQPAQA